MKKILFAFSAALLLISSCVKEEGKDEGMLTQPKEIIISASVDEPLTRTTVSIEDKVGHYAWEENETIAVVADNSVGKAFPFVSQDPSAGTFSYTPRPDDDITNLAFAVTPEDALVVNAGNTPKVENGAAQFQLELSGLYDFGHSNAVMVAGAPVDNGDVKKFTFKHAAALYRVEFENVPSGTQGLKFVADGANITGTFSFQSLENVEIKGADADASSNEAYVILENPVSEAGQTLEFYVPVPTGTYTNVTVSLIDGEMDEIANTSKTFTANAYTVKRGAIIRIPKITLEPAVITKGANYTLTTSSDLQWTAIDQALVYNNMSWLPAVISGADGAAVQQYDSNRGAHFGSKNTGVTEMTFTGTGYATFCDSETAQGISTISLLVGATNDVTVTGSVTVGGVEMSPMSEGSNSYKAANNVAGPISFYSESLLTGDIVIDLTISSQGALYVKEISINPAPTLGVPIIEASSEVSTVTVSWSAVTNAETYDVSITDGGENTFSDNDVTDLVKTFEDVPDGTYVITVTAKAEGYNDGVGTSSVVVKKAGPDRYVLVTDAGAFEDGGKYVLAIQDGEDGSYYFIKPANALIKDALTVSSGVIFEPDAGFIITAENGSTAGTFKLKTSNGQYYQKATTSTTISTGTSAGDVYVTYLEDGAYQLAFGTGSSDRYIAAANTEQIRAYQISNFLNQLTTETSVGQYAGAISVFRFDDGKTNPNLAFNPTSWTNEIGKVNEFSNPLFTKPDGLSVSFTTSNSNVATVSEAGVISVKSAVGTATITASSLEQTVGNVTYRAGEAKFVVTVTKSIPVLVFNDPTLTVEKGSTVTNVVTTTPADLPVTYSSSNEDIATVTSGGVVSGVKKGTAIITASFAGDNSYEPNSANYTVTVTDANANDGSADKPYTASEAAQEALGGNTSEVYVTGIISRITTAYSEEHGNVSFDISDDGLSSSDNQFRIFRATASSDDDFKVGDAVEFKGTLTTYTTNSITIPELNSGNSLIAQVHAPSFSPDGCTFIGDSQTITISSDDGAEIRYTIGTTLPTVSTGTVYSNPLTVSETTTVNAIAVKGNLVTGVVSRDFTKASSYTVQYTQSYSASGNSVAVLGTAPSGSSCTWTTTYTNSNQLTSGKSMTYTITGFGGKTITGLSLHMKTNKSTGEGSVSMKHGNTEFGSYQVPVIGSTYATKDATVTATTIGQGETVTIVISATANSVYCDYITLTYE